MSRQTSATQPVIKVDNVFRTFVIGDMEVEALQGVSLSIQSGEFVAIMGSSGSGKSTLMNILGCLDQPTSGHYVLQGVDVAALGEPDLARIRSERLGFVFQSFNLLPRTSAIENVSLPLYYAASGPKGPAERLDRARKALHPLGLGDRERNTPGQLSGGQQQRVAIARALINAPNLLLADEPTGNLDTRTSHEIMETLLSLNRQQGVTIVLVTHESDIAAYADRIVTMRDGKIVSDKRVAKPGVLAAVGDAERPTFFHPPESQKRTSVLPAGGFLGFALMILIAAAQALGRNWMRSVLTMLGVFIGVAALIVMVAVGTGASEAVRNQIESLGTNVVVVLPGAITTGGIRAGYGSASTLTVVDARAIVRDDPAVAQVGYLIRQQGQVQYSNQNWTTTIQGVSAIYPSITNWRIAAGRGITEEDETRANLVVVIGQTVYRQLFSPGENPIGAYILVKSVPLQVIGVLVAKGQSPFGTDQDDLVMLPFTAAERKVIGVAAPTTQQTPLNWPYLAWPNPFNLQARLTGFVNQIYVQAVTQQQVQTAIHQLTETLVRRHRIKPGAINDFDVRNLSQFVETAESSSRIMALLLAAVASIQTS
jgi:macrolide transport system ATP-binding/permease protein